MGDAGVVQRYLELTRKARKPHGLTDAGLRERFGDPAQVSINPGQVWRARWDDVSVLVLVLTVDTREVTAAPVTIDPSGEDENCVVVNGAHTAFGVDATVWAGLTCSVPLRVLERVVDAWGDEFVRWAEGRARKRQEPSPPGAREGRAIRSYLEPAAELRAELTDDLHHLGRAPAMPVQESGAQAGDLAGLLGDRLNLARLCAALELPQPEVMRILRGKSPLSSHQIQVVASAVGLPAEQIAGTVRPLPIDLVCAMEHPRWRSSWVRRARRLQVSEAEARLSGSYGAFGLAARQTGGGQAGWDARLQEFLRNEGDI
ncbi:hypothetical protein ACFYXS_37480 [Streptomyces sp. NPDC002574]|uniref:hypothetical protein n=1 Tax=Streptomyces sp. NPDC002574 TaxID=3364652 RepID=UPI0036CC22EA